jgi:FixJ family two-component response regulator
MKVVRPLVSVVDDDVSMRESLPDLMRQLGFEAQAFSSAEEFLASSQASKTHCLIVDVGLPRMSGLELLAELTRRGQRISTIFITAQTDRALRAQILTQGAIACLEKPFTETALLEAIAAAVEAGNGARHHEGYSEDKDHEHQD